MPGRLRRWGLAAAVAALTASCSPLGFHLSGSITVSPRLRRKAEQPNTVLFVVATNLAGVPIAVQRIINPPFPLSYHMKNEDLVLPGPVWHGPLQVRVFVNTHGKVGISLRGDLAGEHRDAARSGDRSVDVVVDREI